eukprot:GHVQ01034889.1.p4 GENE.GHVQ01034889.1~~GHVQ01034889.1.p4  ORF type:complete len:110 (+),score=13.07 GHVQ01034889.1:424-753(+)
MCVCLLVRGSLCVSVCACVCVHICLFVVFIVALVVVVCYCFLETPPLFILHLHLTTSSLCCDEQHVYCVVSLFSVTVTIDILCKNVLMFSCVCVTARLCVCVCFLMCCI